MSSGTGLAGIEHNVLRQQDDPRNSVPFNPDLKLSPSCDAFLEAFVNEAISCSGLQERRSVRDGLQAAASAILANLARAHAISSDLYVAISMRGESYRRDRYLSNGLNYRNLRTIRNTLLNREPPYVEVRPGFQDRHTGARYRTRMKATNALVHLLLNRNQREHPRATLDAIAPSSNPSSITVNTSLLFTTLVREDMELVRLKDRDKSLIEYEDTTETNGMRERLREWNSFHHLQWVDLFLPDSEVVSIRAEQGEEHQSDEPQRNVGIDFTRRTLYRVFNNGSFDEGGRFYGGWWQEIPSRYRRYVTINWVPTREIDFSNMQAAMLYARVGCRLESDAYAIEGVPPTYRKLLKQTFFKLINADEGQRVQPPRVEDLPSGWTWLQLQEAVKDRHAPISRYLNSGEGLRLQRVDADIAEDVMLAMMRHGNGILALPIHDSFLVNRFYAHVLEREMKRAYRERMGQEIEIDVDPSFLDLGPVSA